MSTLHRRELTPFNLSFLDVMSCGFGAVVLLVLIVNANTVSHRRKKHAGLHTRAMFVEQKIIAARRHMAELKNSLEKKRNDLNRTRKMTLSVLTDIKHIEKELSNIKDKFSGLKSRTKAMESNLRTLDKEHRRLGAKTKADMAQGNRIRRFEGEGHRQYLTGLKLGGHRVAILVDISASMLDSTILGVILRKNMTKTAKRSSAKWCRTQKTVEWIVANLPHDSSFCIIPFNTGTTSLSPSGKWIRAANTREVNRVMDRFQALVPSRGTSLEKAFDTVASLFPGPDNIMLITDGLPTQGEKRPKKYTVSGEERIRLFERAIRKLPDFVPVNTILFPMEGDPVASALYWSLAVKTRGSFFTPTRDWP